MNLNFSDRQAVVTGGTRGIGAAIARELLSSGCRVVATGTDSRRLTELQTVANQERLSIRYEELNLAEDRSVNQFLKRIASERIDILINSAGINRIGPVSDLKIEDWDEIQRVNVRGPLLLCRALCPSMANRKYGRVLNVTSIFGVVTKEQRAAYSTSKFALLGLTKTLAVEMAKENVLVNALAPGFIDTELTRSILTEEQRRDLAEQTPMKRMGNPDEIAKLAVFLCSESNSFMTGQQIVADGGFVSV